MFVPSLSWKNDRYIYKWLKNAVCLFAMTCSYRKNERGLPRQARDIDIGKVEKEKRFCRRVVRRGLEQRGGAGLACDRVPLHVLHGDAGA